jgi:uncharacterized SAM-binding protein YcdF (DUF218 family)
MSKVLTPIILIVVILYGIGIWLFLLRDDDAIPSHGADAVVVLAGSTKRLPVALSLMKQGASHTLVVSENTAEADPARYRLCHGPKPKTYKLICQQADPFSTRGEARMSAQLAAKNHWLSMVVVSSRYHLYRAEKLFARCTDATLIMRGTDADPWWRKAVEVPIEWAKVLRALTFQRGC